MGCIARDVEKLSTKQLSRLLWRYQRLISRQLFTHDSKYLARKLGTCRPYADSAEVHFTDENGDPQTRYMLHVCRRRTCLPCTIRSALETHDRLVRLPVDGLVRLQFKFLYEGGDTQLRAHLRDLRRRIMKALNRRFSEPGGVMSVDVELEPKRTIISVVAVMPWVGPDPTATLKTAFSRLHRKPSVTYWPGVARAARQAVRSLHPVKSFYRPESFGLIAWYERVMQGHHQLSWLGVRKDRDKKKPWVKGAAVQL